MHKYFSSEDGRMLEIEASSGQIGIIRKIAACGMDSEEFQAFDISTYGK
jgi:hypothetical protein